MITGTSPTDVDRLPISDDDSEPDFEWSDWFCLKLDDVVGLTDLARAYTLGGRSDGPREVARLPDGVAK